MKKERIKFTYRYSKDTEKLLIEGLKKFNISSLNNLIDKLIIDSLVRYPDEQKVMIKQLKELQDKLNKSQVEKGQSDSLLKQLKLAVKQDFDNKELLKKLIS